MRILRKRRGFSTNSSASFEWVPPEATVTEPTVTAAPASPATSLSPANSSLPIQPVTLQTPPPAPFLSTDSPLFGIGLIGALVIGLFILEETVRRIWKKLRGKKHED